MAKTEAISGQNDEQIVTNIMNKYLIIIIVIIIINLIIILIDFFNSIVELCRESEKGITEKMLQIAMLGVSPLVRADAVNKLLAIGKIEICKQGIQLLYRIKEESKAKGLIFRTLFM
jgi:hypothetical protein